MGSFDTERKPGPWLPREIIITRNGEFILLGVGAGVGEGVGERMGVFITILVWTI